MLVIEKSENTSDVQGIILQQRHMVADIFMNGYPSENKCFKEKQVILHKLFCKLLQMLYCLHRINGAESLCVNLLVVTVMVMNTQGWALAKA